MEARGKDNWRELVIVDIEVLVPQDHLLRKIKKVMNYDRLYDRLRLYYCHDTPSFLSFKTGVL